MEQVLEAKIKTDKENKKLDITHLGDGSRVDGLNKCSLKVHVYLKPQDVTLFGNGAFVDVIS